MKKLPLLFVFVLLYSIMSCSPDSDDADEMITDPPVNTNVTYTASVKAIIDNSCISCHGDPLTNGAPMPLLTLENVKEAVENRNLISRIENGSMPPGNAQDLTAAQVQAVKDWQANSFAN